MKPVLFILTSMLFCQIMLAQKKAEIVIQTSAECSMCKERLEKALAYEKGVYSSNLDLKTRKITIIYNPKKTNPDHLRVVISKQGYQADDIKADPFAYEQLPECCKVGGHKNDEHKH
ncbi:MAG: heavy-metal-associated domain-containing protein [Bacteroidales bacterium]|nr:heavy-metal-associated domain-containing protein [Bacteroidales bacterium]